MCSLSHALNEREGILAPLSVILLVEELGTEIENQLIIAEVGVRGQNKEGAVVAGPAIHRAHSYINRPFVDEIQLCELLPLIDDL